MAGTKTDELIDQALTVHDTREAGVAVYESWDDYGRVEDGTEKETPLFPLIKLVQKTSNMKGRPLGADPKSELESASRHGGDWFHSDLEAFQTGQLDVVPLLQRETRALFLEGDDKPWCSSQDAEKPMPYPPLWDNDIALAKLGVESWKGKPPEFCADCPLSVWGQDNEPPPCSNSTVILVDRAAEGQAPDLAQLRLGGKSIKPWRTYVRKVLVPKRAPLFSRRVFLSMKEESRDGKTWFEVMVDHAPRDPKDGRVHFALINEMRSKFAEAAAQVDRDDVRPAVVNSDEGWGDGSESFAGRNAEPVAGAALDGFED